MNLWEEIQKLSVDEKIQLAMDIWDSIPHTEIGLTDEQKRILDERIKEIESGNATFYTWEEVKERAKNRIKNKD